MERSRQLQQTFTDEKEEKPSDQNSEGTPGETQKPHEYGAPGERLPR
jgi:hypothetical protein